MKILYAIPIIGVYFDNNPLNLSFRAVHATSRYVRLGIMAAISYYNLPYSYYITGTDLFLSAVKQLIYNGKVDAAGNRNNKNLTHRDVLVQGTMRRPNEIVRDSLFDDLMKDTQQIDSTQKDYVQRVHLSQIL